MRKAIKGLLIAATVLVLIGVLILVGVIAKNHWDFTSFSSADYETQAYEIHEDFENISIASDTADLQLLPSEDGICRVIVYDLTNVARDVSVQEGTLTIETQDTRNWYERIAFSFDASKITVYLPQSDYAALMIEDSTGEITIPKDFSFASIRISADTGSVACDASASGAVQIATDTGNICVENVSAGELTLAVSTGKVEVRSAVCEGAVDVTVSTGRAILADISCKSFRSEGDTGELLMEHVIVAEQILIARSTGDVRLERCDAAELLVTTDTGDVTGTLLSEKVFITQSDTGHIAVPETTNGGKCKITTDTGDVRITLQ